MQSTAVYPQTTDSLSLNPTALAASVTRGMGWLWRFSGSVPPTSLVLLSSFAVQVGAALSKSLFDSIGEIGAVFVCKAFAASLLLCMWRPHLRGYSRRDYALVVLLGLMMAGMNFSIFSAIARIPLGIASTIEFMGPLALAVIGSRRLLDLVWVTLAASGVMLLAPLGGTSLDPVGIALALLSGGFWAAYILVSVPAGRVFPGGTGLALAMAIATLFLMPVGIIQGGAALLSPVVVTVGIAVAVIGTVLPYSMEYAALKRIPPRIFGVLISIEPAIAALVGFLFLGEQLELRALIAIALVTTAAIGVTLFGKGSTH